MSAELIERIEGLIYAAGVAGLSERREGLRDALDVIRRAPVSAGKVKAREAVTEWLNESEGYSLRVERLHDDAANGNDLAPWLVEAFRMGAGSALQPGDGWQEGIRQLLDADRAFMDAEPLTEAQRALSRHVAMASAYGSAAFMAGIDQDQGTHAMMRALLTALLDPLDPELDCLRADPTAGEKARADRAASLPLGEETR